MCPCAAYLRKLTNAGRRTCGGSAVVWRKTAVLCVGWLGGTRGCAICWFLQLARHLTVFVVTMVSCSPVGPPEGKAKLEGQIVMMSFGQLALRSEQEVLVIVNGRLKPSTRETVRWCAHIRICSSTASGIVDQFAPSQSSSAAKIVNSAS